MIRTQMFMATALIAGVAIGYFVRPETSPAVGSDGEAAHTARVRVADMGETASVAALRARVAELEAALAKREDEGGDGEGVATPADARHGERRGPPSFVQMRERFARMEKEDPQRFAQMTNHFAQMRRHRLERAQSRMDFLASVDTSTMSASARKTHEDLQELIARREELEEQLSMGRDLSDDERRRLLEEMRDTSMAMSELNEAERDSLIAQTADALGLSEEDAAEVAATLRDIVEATDGGMRFHRLPPLPPPDGRGPGRAQPQ